MLAPNGPVRVNTRVEHLTPQRALDVAFDLSCDAESDPRGDARTSTVAPCTSRNVWNPACPSALARAGPTPRRLSRLRGWSSAGITLSSLSSFKIVSAVRRFAPYRGRTSDAWPGSARITDPGHAGRPPRRRRRSGGAPPTRGGVGGSERLFRSLRRVARLCLPRDAACRCHDSTKPLVPARQANESNARTHAGWVDVCTHFDAASGGLGWHPVGSGLTRRRQGRRPWRSLSGCGAHDVGQRAGVGPGVVPAAGVG